jgi:outer membrane lipoprotein SlyB
MWQSLYRLKIEMVRVLRGQTGRLGGATGRNLGSATGRNLGSATGRNLGSATGRNLGAVKGLQWCF